jgi:hypothetical protein
MDLAESGINRKTFIKERGAGEFKQNPPVLHPAERPSKILCHLAQLLLIRNVIANRAKKIHCGVGMLKTM